MPRPYYKNYSHIKLLARNLRKNQTRAEKVVWDLLRKRKIEGLKFLRQHPVFYKELNGQVTFYIPDFYCRELRLIIEVDGDIHLLQKEYDEERDSQLRAKDIRVERIKNVITNDPELLEKTITGIIRARINDLE